MSLTLNSIKPAHGSRVKGFRIGRGAGSGRGKTAGKGTKGQKARTGGGKKLQLKGLKQMLLGFPKTRGFKSRVPKARAISLASLETLPAGSTISVETLRAKGLMMRRDVSAKIVGSGKLSKALKVSGVQVSATAKAAIEAAGGSVS
ncbi:50S ribosomal protein L15 [Patescibacteria group bacterium]|jgi:large subunit ribosomal protein L15|nr:50S ribosomal protein L15 [Candidatus Uhrbacteria bacterium]MCK9361186.1 50S ribosomal protein L15 [Patescibacteria group bacterium]